MTANQGKEVAGAEKEPEELEMASGWKRSQRSSKWRQDVTLQKMIFFARNRYFLLTGCPLMGDPFIPFIQYWNCVNGLWEKILPSSAQIRLNKYSL